MKRNKVLILLVIVAGALLIVAGVLTYKNAKPKRAAKSHNLSAFTTTVAPNTPPQTTPPPTYQPSQPAPMFYVPQITSCPHCGGSGYFVCSSCGGNGLVICPDCGGRGISGYEADIYIGSTGRASVYGRYIQCARCGGTGLARCSTCGGDGKLTCTYCGGRGSIITKGLSSTPTSEVNAIPCPNCGGTGKVKDYSTSFGWRDCERCWSSGWTFPY